MKTLLPALVAGLLAFTTLVNAQQVSHELNLVNQTDATLSTVTMETRTGERVNGDWRPTEKLDLAKNLEGGKTAKATLSPKSATCEWNVTYVAAGKGGGSTMLDLCGKSRILFAPQSDSKLPKLTAD